MPSFSRSSVSPPQQIAVIFLALLALWLTAGQAITALHQHVSFDGAMNLQVSASLAQGHGYRRSYAEQVPFPQEIETNYPFTLPAALIFKLCGVHLWTAQLTNVAYLIALLVVVFLLVRRLATDESGRWSSWGWLAVLICFATPEFDRFGMHGYGEIPALFWCIVGAYLLFMPPSGTADIRLRRVAAAGLMFGLAVATKTVALIGVGAAGLTLLLAGLTSGAAGRRNLLRALPLFVAGILIALIPFEVWRCVALGGPAPYGHWWSEQYGQIVMQSGVRAGIPDTASRSGKIAAHLAILSRSFGLSPVWTGALLGLEFVVIGAAILSVRKNGARGLLVFLLIGAAVYLGWWLAITPTAKAWPRRILDGLLVLQIGVVAAGVLLLPIAWRAGVGRRVVCVVAFGAIAAGLFIPRSDRIIAVGRPSLASPDTAEIMAVAHWLRDLDPVAQAFGEAWYSAPAISLYAGRPLLDLNDWPASRLDPTHPAYLIADNNSLTVHAFAEIKARYQTENLFPDHHSETAYRVDWSHPKEIWPAAPTKTPPTFVDFRTGNSDSLFGFYPERQPWRWIRCDAEALLTYDGASHEFVLAWEANAPQSYIHSGGVTVKISIDGHEIARRHTETAGAFEVRCSASSLGLTLGKPVHVRIQCDNALRLARDTRQLSIRIKQIGFVPGGQTRKSSPPFSDRRDPIGLFAKSLRESDANAVRFSSPKRCSDRPSSVSRSAHRIARHVVLSRTHS